MSAWLSGAIAAALAMYVAAMALGLLRLLRGPTASRAWRRRLRSGPAELIR